MGRLEHCHHYVALGCVGGGEGRGGVCGRGGGYLWEKGVWEVGGGGVGEEVGKDEGREVGEGVWGRR